MKAILIYDHSGAEQFYIGECPTPVPSPGELLIKVKASGINRADILQRQGKYPPPPGTSPIIGLEVAGVVEKFGRQCSGCQKGDRVFGLLSGGGYAEYALMHHQMAMPMPENLSFEEAAAIPEAFLTAYQALHWRGQIRAGEWVLIHAGASGVGTAAIQLVKETRAHSIITAGTEAKLAACRRLGAHFAINYREGPFLPRVLEITKNKGVNLIIDFVGATYWEQNMNALATDGRLVLLAVLGGFRVQNCNLLTLLTKRLYIMGSTLRSRSQEYKIRLTREFARYVLPRFFDGRLKPVLDRVFPWTEVSEAHRYMEENKNIGKLVLSIAG